MTFQQRLPSVREASQAAQAALLTYADAVDRSTSAETQVDWRLFQRHLQADWDAIVKTMDHITFVESR